jgi:hypothetical protein
MRHFTVVSNGALIVGLGVAVPSFAAASGFGPLCLLLWPPPRPPSNPLPCFLVEGLPPVGKPSARARGVVAISRLQRREKQAARDRWKWQEKPQREDLRPPSLPPNKRGETGRSLPSRSTTARRPSGGPETPPTMDARRLGGEDSGLT